MGPISLTVAIATLIFSLYVFFRSRPEAERAAETAQRAGDSRGCAGRDRKQEGQHFPES